MTNWFSPVIMVSYLVVFIDKVISILLSKESTGFLFTCLSALAYVGVCSFGFKIGSFWWNSILCFPLGCLLASNKVFIKKKLPVWEGIIGILLSLILAAACYIASLKFQSSFEAFSCLFASAAVMIGLKMIPLRSFLLCFLGKITFGLYLFHLVGLIISKSTHFNENIVMAVILVLSIAVSYPVITLTKRIHIKGKSANG